jgi:hypothetical protein
VSSRLDDPWNDETFRRVVGKRQTRAPGAPPPAEARHAMAQMAQYRTGAPKGVFRYATHEEANEDRERWTVERLLQVAAQGAPNEDEQ